MRPPSAGKARAVRVFGVALALAGFVPVLLFAVGTVLPAAEASAMLGYFPNLPWLAGIDQWLHFRRVRWSPPIGLVYALPCLALMFFGATIAKRQDPKLAAERARRADALRRAPLYGRMERVEPTLGAGIEME